MVYLKVLLKHFFGHIQTFTLKYHLLNDYDILMQFFVNWKHICLGDKLGAARLVQLKLCQAYLWACSLRALFLFMYQDSLSHDVNVALYNVPYLEGLDGSYNVWLAALLLLGSYNFALMYRKNCGLVGMMFYQVLYEGNNSFFLSRYFHYNNGQRRNFGNFALFKSSKTISKNLKSFAIWSLKLLQCLYYANCE